MGWFNILKTGRPAPEWRFSPIDSPAYKEAIKLIKEALEKLNNLPEAEIVSRDNKRLHKNPRVGRYIRYLERLVNPKDRNSLAKWWKHGRLNVEGADWSETIANPKYGIKDPHTPWEIEDVREEPSIYFYANRPIKGLEAFKKFVTENKRTHQESFEIDQANQIMDQLVRDLEEHFKKLLQSFEHQYVVPRQMEGIMILRTNWDQLKSTGQIVNATEEESHWGLTFTWTPKWMQDVIDARNEQGRHVNFKGYDFNQFRLKINTATQARERGMSGGERRFGLCIESLKDGVPLRNDWCIHQRPGMRDLPSLTGGLLALQYIRQSLTQENFQAGFGQMSPGKGQTERQLLQSNGWDTYLNHLRGIRYRDVYPGKTLRTNPAGESRLVDQPDPRPSNLNLKRRDM